MNNRLLPYVLICCLVYLNLYGQVETSMPDLPDVIIVNTSQLDAFQNLESGNYELALEQFNQLLKDSPNYISALMGKAKSHLEFGQYQEAYDTYLKALEKDSSDTYSLEGLGNAALFLNQAELALSYYKRALIFKPDNAQLYEAIAVSQMCTNDYLNAAESAKMASLMYNKKGIEAPYPLILSYFCYALINDKENMNEVLAYIQSFNFSRIWPYPIIEFIKGDIGATVLISHIQSEKQEIEVHTYIGLKLRLDKQFHESEMHLDWVRDSDKSNVLETLIAKHTPRYSEANISLLFHY